MVIFIVLVIFEMMEVADEDNGYTQSVDAGIFPKGPYIFSGGTSFPANNIVGSPVQQKKVPSEGVWMGIEIEGLSPGTILELGLPGYQTGVIVDSVPRGSAAEKAGLKNNDIIKAINGQIIVNMADYIKATRNQKITSAGLLIVRDGMEFNIFIPPEGMGSVVQTASSKGSGKSIPPITRNANLPHPYWGVCRNCHTISDGPAPISLPNNSQVGALLYGNSTLPSPARQNAAQKVLVEGHWVGMELITITPELAQIYQLPDGVNGLLVDEVTLEAAESGLLAGDVLQSVNNYKIKTLEDFAQATGRVEYLPAATLGVLRNGKTKKIMIRSRRNRLGVAQNEAAQPIQPGAISPHKDRGRAGTDCHLIMNKGVQL